jgi:hypothetical protein
MTRWLVCSLALVYVLALSACATTRSQSNKQASYSGHPDRIYVIVLPQLSDQMGADFSQQAIARFSDEVAKCQGRVRSHISSPLELDASSQAAEAKAFNPDVVMSMNFAGGTRDRAGGWLPARIDVRMWQPGGTQLVWRAVSSISAGGLAPVSTRVDSFMKDLVARMRNDGVFPTCT